MARGDLVDEQKAQVREDADGLLWRGVCAWAARAQKDRLRKLLGSNESNVVHRLRGEILVLAMIPTLVDEVMKDLETARKQGGGN